MKLFDKLHAYRDKQKRLKRNGRPTGTSWDHIPVDQLPVAVFANTGTAWDKMSDELLKKTAEGEATLRPYKEAGTLDPDIRWSKYEGAGEAWQARLALLAADKPKQSPAITVTAVTTSRVFFNKRGKLSDVELAEATQKLKADALDFKSKFGDQLEKLGVINPSGFRAPISHDLDDFADRFCQDIMHDLEVATCGANNMFRESIAVNVATSRVDDNGVVIRAGEEFWIKRGARATQGALKRFLAEAKQNVFAAMQRYEISPEDIAAIEAGTFRKDDIKAQLKMLVVEQMQAIRDLSGNMDAMLSHPFITQSRPIIGDINRTLELQNKAEKKADEQLKEVASLDRKRLFEQYVNGGEPGKALTGSFHGGGECRR